tara:strand:- start:284371 stop:285687 length:1317 start_codon:yes stop_codon:yes gene_type:complete
VNKYVVFLVLALVAGTAAGWATNQYRYGYRYPQFGPITMDGKVTAANAVETFQSQQPEATAVVELADEPRHDFGVMAPGDEGEHAFTIKNVGSEPLTLRIGATSCKCTLGSLEKDSLAPGEQTDVTLSWTVKTDASEFSQSAQLHTNDPSQPVINLAVTGRVVREIEMVPKALSFGEIASGEPIELNAKVYNYLPQNIEPTEIRFTSEEMTELSHFDVQEYEPTEEEDQEHAAAKQAFRLTVTIDPGLQQGSISQNLLFGFRKIAGVKSGDEASVQDSNADVPDASQDDNARDEESYLVAATTGRVVGQLSMIPNPKLTGREGGGYIYTFGRLGKDDSLTGKAFVVLKGSQRENTKLTIGKANPEGVLDATLGEPLSKGSMTLYPLELKLIPGKEPIERLGQSKDDYGIVWIESDNPAVPRMRIGVKFAIPSKSRLAK